MEEIFDNIKNEIFEEIMYSVWGETGNRYLKTYNKILTDSTKFLEIIKNSNNYNGKEAVENLMLQAIDNINQMSRLNKMLNSLELEFKRVFFKEKGRLETLLIINRKTAQTVHQEAMKLLKTQKEKEEFLKVVLSGNESVKDIEENLEDIGYSTEAIEIERKKVEMNLLVAKEAVHMIKKVYDRNNGGN